MNPKRREFIAFDRDRLQHHKARAEGAYSYSRDYHRESAEGLGVHDSLEVRLGSKADIGLGARHVPLPPKADIAEVKEHVRFVPKADISVRQFDRQLSRSKRL